MMLKEYIAMLVLISVTEVKMRKIQGIDLCIEHKHFKMDCEEYMGNRMPVNEQIVYLESKTKEAEWL